MIIMTPERLLLLLFTWMLVGVGLVAAVPSSTTTTNTCPTFFGVSKKHHAPLAVRGGQVLEAETLQDVESILLRAGSEQQLVVIDFTATWCGPCKMIAPLFRELSDAMPNVVFVKVDVDDNPDTAAKYSVSAMPTFVFIKGGTVVDRLMGANPARLQELIDQHQ